MQIGGFPTDLTQPSGGASPQAGGKDQFLRMFLTQLRNQDPLAPQDSSAFVAQLAQFASVEQLAQANQQLGALGASQDAAARASLTDLVGRVVTARADSFGIAPGNNEPPPLFVHLQSPAKEVQVSIFDESGNLVKTISVGPSPSGDLDLHWDGTGENGAMLPPGSYHVTVSAKGSNDQLVGAAPIFKGRVGALDLSSGSPLFQIGGVLLTPGTITTVLSG